METTKNNPPTGQHTQGEWEIRGNKIFIKGCFNSVATIHVQKNYEERTFKPIVDIEAEANAKLIAEAGNVANQTGMTPMQILKQRNELLQALKDARAFLSINGLFVNNAELYDKIESAISDATI